MYLSSDEQSKADKMRDYLMSHPLEDHIKCKTCRGTGLLGVFQNGDGSFSWHSGEFCDVCKGIGFIT